MIQVQKGDALQLPFDNDSVDFMFGSPPYANKPKYDGLPKYDTVDWDDFMVRVTEEALRVARGCVGWVMSGSMIEGDYTAACEEFMISMKRSTHARIIHPCIWVKATAPSGDGSWYSNSWEYVMFFTKASKLPYFSVAEIATPLKYRNGGAFRQRNEKGKRVADDKRSAYPTHTMRRRMPNVVYTPVGGGHMGSPLACENEAPFPEKLVEYFLPCLCPPGGTVLDPFCGSGTTLAVAQRLGRSAIGLDIRQSQVDLTKKRLGL